MGPIVDCLIFYVWSGVPMWSSGLGKNIAVVSLMAFPISRTQGHHNHSCVDEDEHVVNDEGHTLCGSP